MRRERINYIKIFNVDVKHKITHIKLYRISSILFAICMICLLLQVFIIKMEYLFNQAVAGFTLLGLVLMVIMCLNPFHCLFRTDIILLWKTFLNILIAPFGLVQFRHFFLTDILTSLIQSLRDIGFIVCFFANGYWLRSEEANVAKCGTPLENYIVAISFIPPWIRFAQCFKKYYDDPKRDTKTFYNAGKYFMVLMV